MLRLRRAGFLLSTDGYTVNLPTAADRSALVGPHHNVVKLKPPMCFSMTDAEALLKALDTALYEVTEKISLDHSSLKSHAGSS